MRLLCSRTMSVSRNVRLLSWFNFFLDFRPYMPVVVLYFAAETGSFALGMTVLSISMIASSVFEVPTGVLSDRVGRKRTMILGSIACAFGTLLWAIGGSFWLLATGSVLAGLGDAFFSGNNNAFLHDTLKQEGQEGEFAHFLGRTSSLFQLGLGFSALLGGFISEYALSYAMWAGLFPQMVCVVLTFFMIEPKIHTSDEPTNIFEHLSEAFRHFRKNARLRSLSIASMLDFGVGQASFFFLPVFFATLWPLWAIGLARSLCHMLAFISFWFAGRVIRHFEAFQSLLFVKAASHVTVLIGYVLRNLFSPLLISLVSIGYGVKVVSENALLQQEFTDRQRATMGSLNQFGGSIVFAIASVVIGYCADRFGTLFALTVSELILFAGIILYWKAFRHPSAT